MPLANRVTPFGDMVAAAAHGDMMGNRGGRLHDATRRLGRRRWVSRAWICCRLSFKDRHREVWGEGYTELFFLDEATALAAGHRPCFECRRTDALAFAAAWACARGEDARASATHMDRVLHDERLAGRSKRLHPSMPVLPDGTFVTLSSEAGSAFAVRGALLLRWSHDGYTEVRTLADAPVAAVVTPPAIVAVLAAGYVPRWHPSAA
jgi:hypothetical protein